ncbi:MAG TPA: hypothetical protein ENN80_04645 [Candidatus Hydrogenedentes bacterium]|nr:hypothetical protein [Candidatus Hydrogenedentota bacterium]
MPLRGLQTPLRRFATLIPLLAMALVAAWGVEEELLRMRMKASEPGMGPMARAGAVHNAEQAVLVQTLESMVGEGAWSTVAPLLIEPKRYLHSTRILHSEEQDGVTTVEIEARVFAKALRAEAAKALLQRPDWAPKVLVLAAERLRPKDAFRIARDGTAQKAIEDALRGRGFEVADVGSVLTRYKASDLAERVRGGLAEAKSVAREHVVDACVLVEAVAEPDRKPTWTNIYRVTGKVSARVLRPADGKLLKAVAHDAVISGANPYQSGQGAVENACARLVDDIAEACVFGAVDIVPREGVVITIEPLGSALRLDAVTRLLESMAREGVVTTLYCNEAGARVTFVYDGPMSVLVDALVDHRFEGFRLEARHVVEQDVRLRVVE